MRYLLDVNTLIALGHVMHAHHQRVQTWQNGLKAGVDVLGTCAITELGFVRVSVQAGLQADIFAAQAALERLKATGPVTYELWPDALGADRLPAYLRKPAELTDGHLLELARAHQAQLARWMPASPGRFSSFNFGKQRWRPEIVCR